MTFVQAMIRQGVTNSTFKVGDKVTVAVNPYRSGQPGGSYRGAIDVRGKRYGALDPTAARAAGD
jgi:ribosomal protein L21E